MKCFIQRIVSNGSWLFIIGKWFHIDGNLILKIKIYSINSDELNLSLHYAFFFVAKGTGPLKTKPHRKFPFVKIGRLFKVRVAKFMDFSIDFVEKLWSTQSTKQFLDNTSMKQYNSQSSPCLKRLGTWFYESIESTIK